MMRPIFGQFLAQLALKGLDQCERTPHISRVGLGDVGIGEQIGGTLQIFGAGRRRDERSDLHQFVMGEISRISAGERGEERGRTLGDRPLRHRPRPIELMLDNLLLAGIESALDRCESGIAHLRHHRVADP